MINLLSLRFENEVGDSSFSNMVELQETDTLNPRTQRRVAIQGVAGCWHDAAARAAFPDQDVTPVECDTFEQLFDAISRDATLTAVLAIENTIAGALMTNHELLRQSRAQVVGEVRMRITHALAAIPGRTLDDISEVWSHPMALMQCDKFLHSHPRLRKIEHLDTAGAALDIKRDNIQHRAAICSELAAERYGLNVLESGIETNKRNFTRFLVLADPSSAHDLAPKEAEVDKASIVFTLPHQKGALSKILAILSFYDINLSKIQSSPIIGREWEYRFYVDLTFDSIVRYHQAIDAIRPLMGEFKVLGQYKERLL